MGTRWGQVRRRDPTEDPIVEVLESVGAKVFRLHQPADLLVRFRGKWFVLEVTHGKRGTRDAEQLQILKDCEIPLVVTAHEALKVIGAFTK